MIKQAQAVGQTLAQNTHNALDIHGKAQTSRINPKKRHGGPDLGIVFLLVNEWVYVVATKSLNTSNIFFKNFFSIKFKSVTVAYYI